MGSRMRGNDDSIATLDRNSDVHLFERLVFMTRAKA